MNDLPVQLSVKQVSEIFGIPENTLRAYIHRRIIPYRRVRGRIYFVTDALIKWLAEFDVEPRQGNGNAEATGNISR